MTPNRLASLKADFLAWSGGFTPESTHQITVYLDYTLPLGQNREAARRTLEQWMTEPESDGISAETSHANLFSRVIPS